ncbi:MAG: DDE-type integrase/transposase/recombinase [Ardenticatenaceae bacterium]|nr:DDE-type integrase/transposase/recombinase [Ardenticatenaceae bacterium]
MQPTLHRQLVLDTFRMASKNQRPQPGLLHHSDQGSQYASYDYQQLLADHQVQVSMSRRGNCYDHAPVESFFATRKAECVRGIVYPSRTHARAELFEYIEIFYNRQRLHSQLGYRTPVEYELLPAVSQLFVHYNGASPSHPLVDGRTPFEQLAQFGAILSVSESKMT